MKENRDFIIIDPEGGYESADALAKVQLIEGEFQGVTYSYGVVDIGEEDQPKISFEYTIHSDNKDEILSNAQAKLAFEKNISRVLNSILTEQIKIAEERYSNELREENT